MKFRVILKTVISWIAIACVAPLALSERFARRLLKRDVWFVSHADALSLIPGIFGRYLRNAYYHLTLQRCPLDCRFVFGMVFTHSEADVGHRTYVGARSRLGTVSIGADTLIGDHVHILSGGHQHNFDDPDSRIREQPVNLVRVNIGTNCWIGTNSVVMADIGNHCVIGAGSVVTNTIPDSSVAAGNPARVLRSVKERQPVLVRNKS